MWLSLILVNALGWALINVLDSTIVHRYEKSPFVLMWCQSFFSIAALAVLVFVLPLETTWVWILLPVGAFTYLGDLWFFRVLEHVDVSVSNVAWAIASVFLSIAGFLLFQETWTPTQFFGAALIIGASLALSLWHRHPTIGVFRYLILLALLYVPFQITKKAALADGQSVTAVFFWLILGRELLSFSVPWFWPAVRSAASDAMRRGGRGFMVLNGLVIFFFLLAEFTGSLAFERGPLSLSAVIGNAQPFFVIILSGLFLLFVPRLAPREAFGLKITGVKIAGFAVVIIGLALLGVSQ